VSGVSEKADGAPVAAEHAGDLLDVPSGEDEQAGTGESTSSAAEPPVGEPGTSAQSGPSPPPPVVVPRWVQLVVLPLSILALYVIAKAAGKVLVIFIVAAVIALILNPAVAFVQRRGVPRALAVLTVYLAFFLTLTGIGLLLANPISNQVAAFSHNVPHLVKQANQTLAELQRTLNEGGVHVHFINQGETALQTLGDKIVKGSSSLVSFGGALLTEVVQAGFDVLLVFVLSIYMLVYGESIGRLVRRLMPPGDGTPHDDYPALVQNAVARYVGGQLLFSLIMGTTAALALYIFGVLGIFPDGERYAVVFGVFYGLMELIPYIGPIIGALPPVLVALFTNPISAVWVTLLFIGLQQLEGHVVAPQIFGKTLRINPLLVIFALLLGFQVHGVVGALIALPILAVLRETAVYLHRHLTFEPWGPGPPGSRPTGLL
jgi:predicted PurR-regulated permease PerM